MFTLAKNWTEVFKSMIVWYRSVAKERRIYHELAQFDSAVVGDAPGTTKLVRSLIKQRMKRRNCTVTFV